MNGSGKQSFYEIQLSNSSLIVAFLVAAAVGVTVFVLGVMVGRGQAPQTLPESGWAEAIDAGGSDQQLEEAPALTELGDPGSGDPAAAATADAATPPPFEDVVADTTPAVEQPSAPMGLPANDPTLANGWVVQVKSTDDEAEARTLQAELSRSGFPTFVVQADVRGSSVWRVRVGRYGAEADAARVAAALSGRTDVADTWVTQG
jgi:cell division septation protein DedD